jgi:hypothetical protein
MYKPDYTKLRDETVFSWRVSATYTALPKLTEVLGPVAVARSVPHA